MSRIMLRRQAVLKLLRDVNGPTVVIDGDTMTMIDTAVLARRWKMDLSTLMGDLSALNDMEMINFGWVAPMPRSGERYGFDGYAFRML